MHRIPLLIVASLVFACTNDTEPARAVASEPAPAADRSRRADAKPEETLSPTWFHEHEDLPAGHPCHDEATIHQLRPKTIQPWSGLNSTTAGAFSLGGVYEDSADWLSPRTVSGVRWEERGSQLMVATCDISARARFARYARWPTENGEVPASTVDELSGRTDPQWFLDDVTEPPRTKAVDHSIVRWMRRTLHDGPWETIREADRAGTSDVAQAEITRLRSTLLSAQDADGDGELETSVMVLWEFECDEPIAGCPPVIQLQVREGESACDRTLYLGETMEVFGSVTLPVEVCRDDERALPADEYRLPSRLDPPPPTGEINQTLEALLRRDERRALATAARLLRR